MKDLDYINWIPGLSLHNLWEEDIWDYMDISMSDIFDFEVDNWPDSTIEELCNAVAPIQTLSDEDKWRIAGVPFAWFTTIRKFKGLESPIVILTDIDSKRLTESELLYIALTRATDNLYILAHKDAEKDLQRRMASLG